MAVTTPAAAFRVHVRRSAAGYTHRMIVAVVAVRRSSAGFAHRMIAVVAVHIFFQDVKSA
jgi:hypothetical protein